MITTLSNSNSIESGREPSASEVRPMGGGGGGTVRLLFMYTPAAAASNNVTLVANNLISQFNQSLNLSNVNTSNSIVLAGLKSIGDNLTTYNERCTVPILMNMGDGVDAFYDLDDWMGDAYADVGILFATAEPSYTECHNDTPSYGRFGGAGWAGYQETHPTPFAVTTDTFALGSLNALHEIGHVLNGRHEDDCGLSEPPQACGYIYDDGVELDDCVWQTMMGGYLDTGCEFDLTKPPSQQDNPRIARWSNPGVSYGGVPTGVEDPDGDGDDEDSIDMAYALDVNMPHASDWEDNPPSAPNPISNSSWYCFGQNTVSWTAQASATEYRLYKMDSSPALLYGGPNTQVNLNVSSAGYVAAKACNAGGCSGYSNQVYATYYSVCQ